MNNNFQEEKKMTKKITMKMKKKLSYTGKQRNTN